MVRRRPIHTDFHSASSNIAVQGNCGQVRFMYVRDTTRQAMMLSNAKQFSNRAFVWSCESSTQCRDQQPRHACVIVGASDFLHQHHIGGDWCQLAPRVRRLDRDWNRPHFERAAFGFHANDIVRSGVRLLDGECLAFVRWPQSLVSTIKGLGADDSQRQFVRRDRERDIRA